MSSLQPLIASEPTQGDVHFTTFFHAQHVGPELPLIHGIIGPDDSVIAERTAYISGNYFQTHMVGLFSVRQSLQLNLTLPADLLWCQRPLPL